MQTKYNKYFCQHCGSDTKLVDTKIYDKCIIDPNTGEPDFVGFTDDFEHTGNDICANCERDWSGEVL